MKLLPILAINLAAMGVVLIAYDLMRATPAPQVAPQEVAGTDATGLADDALEKRLRALESDRRRPRKGANVDASILERLDALEAARSAAGGDPAVEELSAEPIAMTDEQPAQMAARGAPTPAEIQRFRDVRAAVRIEDIAAKHAARIDATLDKLSLNLTDRQREQIHSAYAAFEPRIDQIWGEAKAEAQRTVAAGGQVSRADVVADTTALIQSEFAATLEGVVPAADGETIADALLSRGK